MECTHVFSLVATMLCLYASAGYAKELETINGTIYCDNNFTFFIDGELIQQDPVDTFPHNAVNVTFSIPKDEPVVFAFTARDWSNQTTGLEYDNQCIGDGGLRAMFSNGIVTNSSWKCWTSLYGPVNWQACYAADPRDGQTKVLPLCKQAGVPPFVGCYNRMRSLPADWNTLDFDTSAWENAIEYEDEFVGWGLPPTDCDDPTVYVSPDTDRDGNPLTCPRQIDWSSYGDSKFIWGDDLDLDNTIHCRYIYREHLLTVDSGAPSVAKFSFMVAAVVSTFALVVQ